MPRATRSPASPTGCMTSCRPCSAPPTVPPRATCCHRLNGDSSDAFAFVLMRRSVPARRSASARDTPATNACSCGPPPTYAAGTSHRADDAATRPLTRATSSVRRRSDLSETVLSRSRSSPVIAVAAVAPTLFSTVTCRRSTWAPPGPLDATLRRLTAAAPHRVTRKTTALQRFGRRDGGVGASSPTRQTGWQRPN